MIQPLRLALTAGEPAGIGPELCVQLAQQPQQHELVVIADPALLQARARLLDVPLRIRHYASGQPVRASLPGELCVLPTPLNAPSLAGQLNTDNAAYVLSTLRRAAEGCLSGEFAALVTAPVHKGIINDAGIPFSGHTEFFQELCGSDQVVMMLATDGLRVALLTTHLPLAQVAAAITPLRIRQICRILHRELQQRFDLPAPRILVCGLNPHAGEGGHLGREELEVIEPTLKQLRAEGLNLIGPLPADTLFSPHLLAQADAVLAMYHDQGLPVLKFKGFGRAANITLGLPIIRTSVDHGTALDLAGTGTASIGSLITAIDCAADMATHSHQQTI